MALRQQFSLRFGDKTLELGERTALMAILNVTPDSFYDGGRHFQSDVAIPQAEKFLEEGADILDIGGQSTRPGSEPVGSEEELRRILPVILSIRKKTNAWISIDTYNSAVAEVCLKEGADIINDVSSFRIDPQMPVVLARYGAPVVCMHFWKSIHPMPAHPVYEDLFGEIVSFFRDTLERAARAGVDENRIIIDPGIGFGKTLEHNLNIMRHLDFLQELKKPVLVGPSRKSFIQKITGLAPEERLEGTAAAVGVCVMQGAHIVRVHDVQFFRRYCSVLDELIKA